MKIFCIGLSKTGTTSLTTALGILGYASVRWQYTRKVFRYTAKGIEVRFDKFKDHDAFGDTPIARIYPRLDRRFPNSKFILTVRDIPQWEKSFRDMFGAGVQGKFSFRLHMDLYGTDSYDRDLCLSAFTHHTEQVLGYFEARRHDLLVMDIGAGDGWEKLCPFLNKPVPAVPFPFRYTKKDRADERKLGPRLSRVLREPQRLPGRMLMKLGHFLGW